MYQRFFNIICVISLFLFPITSYAATKNFSKQTTAVIPSNQSQDQIVAYLTSKLTREAVEEAGVFVSSELIIDNSSISKDEVVNIAGAIAQIKVAEVSPFIEGKRPYVRVKVDISVDTDNVTAFLNNTTALEKAKKEAATLREQNLELEKKLKNATKSQYEQDLSEEVKQQVALQQKQSLEYQRLSTEAREKLLQTKKDKAKLESLRENELSKMSSELETKKEEIALEEKHLRERLSLLAQQNRQANFSKEKNIQEVLNQVGALQKQLRNLMDDYDSFLAKQKESILSYYAEQKKMRGNFSLKDKWETNTEYYNRTLENARLEQTLHEEEQEALFEEEYSLLSMFTTSIQPIAESLEKLQNKAFPSAGEHADITSMGDVYPEFRYFDMKVKYLKNEYMLSYSFKDSNLQEIKILYQQPEQFLVIPLFGIQADKKGNFKKILSSFLVKQLATNKSQEISNYQQISGKLSPKLSERYIFPEIVRWKNYLTRYGNMKEIKNNPIPSVIAEFKRTPNLQKYTQIISNLESVNSLTSYDKLERIQAFRLYVQKVFRLDRLPIKLLTFHGKNFAVVLLKKNGRVTSFDQAKFFSRRFEEAESWRNIVDILDIQGDSGNIFKEKLPEEYIMAYDKNKELFFAPTDAWTAKLPRWKNIKKIIISDDNTYILTNSGIVFKGKHSPVKPSSQKVNWKEVNTGIQDIAPGWDGSYEFIRKNDSVVQYFVGPYHKIITLTKNGKIKLDTSFTRKPTLKKILEQDWSDIVKVDQAIVGGMHSEYLGLQEDGTVVRTVTDIMGNVVDWEESKFWIKDMVGSGSGAILLKENGTIGTLGGDPNYTDSDPFLGTKNWSDIIEIFMITGVDFPSHNIAIGLDQKGRVLASYDYVLKDDGRRGSSDNSEGYWTVYSDVPDMAHFQDEN